MTTLEDAVRDVRTAAPTPWKTCGAHVLDAGGRHVATCDDHLDARAIAQAVTALEVAAGKGAEVLGLEAKLAELKAELRELDGERSTVEDERDDLENERDELRKVVEDLKRARTQLLQDVDPMRAKEPPAAAAEHVLFWTSVGDLGADELEALDVDEPPDFHGWLVAHASAETLRALVRGDVVSVRLRHASEASR